MSFKVLFFGGGGEGGTPEEQKPPSDGAPFMPGDLSIPKTIIASKAFKTIIETKLQDIFTEIIPYIDFNNKTKGTGNAWKNPDLLDELASSGAKYSPENVLAVTKTADGKLVWLEIGNSKAGMQNILDHADDLANKGIQQNQIQDLVMESLTNGKVVGHQGRGTGRPIYEVTFEGKTYHNAVTVGDNGFIVGANPTTWP